MTLWQWAGAVWDRPGVGAAALALQDDHGQCIPLLLWALWRHGDGGRLDDVAARAAALCREMDEAVIAPLRLARRDAAPLDRERLLANELKAEHELIDQLEALQKSPIGLAATSRLSRKRGDVGIDLSIISALWGRPLEPVAFGALIQALAIREVAGVG